MKEITYEEWQKNPTPRMMWVWDNPSDVKKKAKVICVAKDDFHLPVMTVTKDYDGYCSYRHCAEIEKQRRMTNKELSRWLRGKPTREYKYLTSDYICSTLDYREYRQDEEVHEDIRIREDYGVWREPLVEVEE